MRFLLVIFALASTPALSATLSGRITGAGMGLSGMEVRLWARTAKGYSFDPPRGRLVTTDASGNYTFTNVAAGTYKLDTRMNPMLVGNWGDRWFDVAAPTANGYVAADADELVLADPDVRTGLDITVELNGGVDGQTVTPGGTPIGGLTVRLESLADARVHHHDTSKTVPAVRLGEHSFRGMPAGLYRFIVHDPNYVYADVIGTTPSMIGAGANGMSGDLTVPLVTADPNEPNNRPDAGSTVNVGPLRQSPPLAVEGSAAIGPRNTGDVDFYCWSAQEGDRYLLSVVGTLGTWADGGVRESPYVDPVLSFWRGAVKVLEDDDSGPQALDARLDTGVQAAGPVCAAVTTFGDTTWAGQNQGSAGPYRIRLVMGNRQPTVSTSSQGAPTPAVPGALMLNEGASLQVAVAYADPDQDALTATWDLRDSQSRTLSSGSFTGGSGQVPFVASQSAARQSPYTLTVRVADAEFTVTRVVRIAVAGTNQTPSIPQPISPDAGAVVTTSRPPLVCRESVDDDADPLTYEFLIVWADGGTVFEQGSVQGNDAGIDPDGGTYGLITFVPRSLPENGRFLWRVRAFDGDLLNGSSAFSEDRLFTVDTTNEPPPPPPILKPADGDTLLVRRPTIELGNVVDPEGDSVAYVVELARDQAFTQVIAISPNLPAATGSPVTMWTLEQDLPWGAQFWARALSLDGRGARGMPGAAVSFRTRGNTPPMAVAPGAPFSAGLCADQIFLSAPMSLVVPPVNDVEQDVVMVEVQVTKADDRQYLAPLFKTEVRASPSAETAVPLTSVAFEVNQKYLVRLRSKDGQNVTEWVECSFSLEGSSGVDGGSGVSVTTPKPCGCSSAPMALLAVAALLLPRRRRVR